MDIPFEFACCPPHTVRRYALAVWPQRARMPYDANVDPLTVVVVLVDLDPIHHFNSHVLSLHLSS